MSLKPEALVRNIAEVMWETPLEHYDAHSKMLVTPQNSSTRHLDYRISSYQPNDIFIPPGVEHAIYNTGLADLVFIVVTAPPSDA